MTKKKLNSISLLLGGPGIILQFVGSAIDSEFKDPLALLVWLFGYLLLVAGIAFYAKSRGRSAWWALAGLASCAGLLVLLFLRDKNIETKEVA